MECTDTLELVLEDSQSKSARKPYSHSKCESNGSPFVSVMGRCRIHCHHWDGWGRRAAVSQAVGNFKTAGAGWGIPECAFLGWGLRQRGVWASKVHFPKERLTAEQLLSLVES